MSENEQLSDTSKDAEFVLEAINCELPVEVILFAMYALQQNPKLSVRQAIIQGYNEWFK